MHAPLSHPFNFPSPIPSCLPTSTPFHFSTQRPHVQKAPGPAYPPISPPALPVPFLGYDRRGEPTLASVRLWLRPKRPCPRPSPSPCPQWHLPPCTGHSSSRAPRVSTIPPTFFYKTTTIANKSKDSSYISCGAQQRETHGESISVLDPPPFIFIHAPAEISEYLPFTHLSLFIGNGRLSRPRSAITTVRTLA
jgi:hypothetical protein